MSVSIPTKLHVSSSVSPRLTASEIRESISGVFLVGAPSERRPRRERLAVGCVGAAGIVSLECPLLPPCFAIKTRPGAYGEALESASRRSLRSWIKSLEPESKCRLIVWTPALLLRVEPLRLARMVFFLCRLPGASYGSFVPFTMKHV